MKKNSFWSRLSLIAFIICALSVSVTAGQYGDFAYYDDGVVIKIADYTGPGGAVTIPDTINGKSVTSIGNYAFYYCIGLTSVTIPDSVTYIGYRAFYECAYLTSVTIGNGVNSIIDEAFYDCISLTNVTIPDSVTSIGNKAFYCCSGLTSATIGNGVISIGNGAFYNCSGLTSATIGNGVISIGNSAFYNCSGLTSVTIPNSVTSIGDGAFSGCPGLTSFTVDTLNSVYGSEAGVLFNRGKTTLLQCPGSKTGNYTVPDSVTSIVDYAFYCCTALTGITIPNSVTSIGDSTFYGCSSLTSATIGNSVTRIGTWAFYGCSRLTTVTIPSSVTSIGGAAFRDCTKLTSVTIPDGVTSIGSEAFSGCNRLTTVTIPSSVASIGDEAFRNCIKLTSVTISDGVTSIGKNAFSYCTGLSSISIPDSVASIGSGAFQYCNGLTSITISDSVTSIGDYVFSGCTKLTSIIIPSSVTSIGSSAFSSCAGLTSVTMGNSVTSIGGGAFYWCPGLTSVVIPDSVTSIGGYAFSDCSGLTSITIGKSVTSIGDEAFYNCTKLTSVTIPDSVNDIGQNAFSGCTKLNSAIFLGNAPSMGAQVFSSCAYNFSVYYRLGALDFTSPTWEGYPASAACILTYNAGTGGSIAGYATQAVKQGTNGTGVTAVQNYGYHFVKWSDDVMTASRTEINVNANITVTATFAINTYTVTFDLANKGTRTGGGELSQMANHGNAVTVPTVNAAQGWIFTGWDRTLDNITSVTTITAVYSPVTYTVTYDAEGGAVSPTSKSVDFGSVYGALAAPTRTAYTFAGWWTGDNGTGSQITEMTIVSNAANHTIYAKWIFNTYTVIFNLSGKGMRTGGGELRQTIEHGSAAIAPTVSGYTGWTFTGWDKTFDNITSPLTVTAQWIIDSPVIDGSPVIGSPGPQRAMVGIPFTLPLTIVSAPENPLKSVTVTGLPAGLKYDAKTMAITGASMVSGNNTVTITAKNTSNTPSVLTFAMIVDALPIWAQGVFNGSCVINNDSGMATMTVSVLGKVAGKLSVSGKNYAFSAGSYLKQDEDGAFWISTGISVDKADLPLTLKVANPTGVVPPALSVTEGWFANEVVGDPAVKMYRNVWKDTGMDAVLQPYIGYYTAVLPGAEEYGSGYLTLTVDNSGSVKITGKLADGTVLSLGGTLIVDGNEPACLFTVIYTSPMAYKGGFLFGVVEFVAPEEDGGKVFLRLLDGIPFQWENRNPQATAEYDAGFDRELGLKGGWYSTLINLSDYYENGLTVGGIEAPPTLLAAVRYTDFDPESEAENPPKKTTTVMEEVGDAGVSPNDLVLAVKVVKDVGTGLLAPKADTPKKDHETGEYNYDLVNPTGLTLSFTRATGIFKGAFNVYYDYISAQDNTTDKQTYAHVAKKASFEGVLTPVHDPTDGEGIGGRGFYLWPGKSSYDSGRIDKNEEPIMMPYSFNWSYDFLILGNQ